MEKLLKICNLPQGSGYVPGINLKGSYLSTFGFNVGEIVFVEIKDNEIVIKKASPTAVFEVMKNRNPHLKQFAKELDLVA